MCNRLVMCTFFTMSLLFFTAGSSISSTIYQERYFEEPVFESRVLVREAGIENSQMMLLIHGLGDLAGHSWDGVIPELAKKYHLVIPDLPGFGQSSKGNRLYSPDNYASFIDWLVKQMPLKPLILVGHSLGGVVAFTYTARFGENLQALVLVDSVGFLHRLSISQGFVNSHLNLNLPGIFSKVESLFKKSANVVLEKIERIPLSIDQILSSETGRNNFLKSDPNSISALALVQTDLTPLMLKVKTPVWLYWGEDDLIAPLRIGEILSWILPETQLEIFPKIGHSPMLENPSLFAHTLLNSLERQPLKPSEVLKENPYKDAHCKNEQGRHFSGPYRKISIEGCKDVLLRDVRADFIELVNSEVQIVRTEVGTSESSPAVHISGSKANITATDIHGITGILTKQSRLDIAGVRFFVEDSAILGEGNSSSVLLSSSFKYRNKRIKTLHLNQSIGPRESL